MPPDTTVQVEKKKDLIRVATGRQPATLLLKNCKLVNVYTNETYLTDIAVWQDTIASITAGAVTKADKIIDCNEMYAIPGFIDPHMHVDTTMLWPNELARVLVPRGTTTVCVDTVNIAHNGGIPAIHALMDAFKGLPLRALFSAPSYCPLDPELETAAAEIHASDIEELLQDDRMYSIGETVSSKILNLEDDFLAGMAACDDTNKLVSGHAGDLPAGDDAALDAYVAAGVRDDHCTNKPEVLLQRLRRGLNLFLVEAPGRQQVDAFYKTILAQHLPTDQMSLCIDNITIMDIVGEYGGYLDKPFRMGLAAGMPAADMVRMASLNTARHYHLENQIGSLTPGRLADIVLLKELDSFPPEMVFVGGKLAAQRGVLLETPQLQPVDEGYRNSIHLPAGFSAASLEVRSRKQTGTVEAKVIVADDGNAFNQCIHANLSVKDGIVQPDKERDIAQISIIERYGRRGSMTNAFVQGFKLHRGALATSYSIPSNNIVTVGTNTADMAFAVQHLQAMQGGFVVVADGEVLAEVRLGIGGIMSDQPYEKLLADVEKANAASSSIGCEFEHPFFTMAQTVLSSLPALGLTDRGLVDVAANQIVPVIQE